MQRIKTQEEIKRKQRKNQMILGIVLITLMIASTIGFALMSGDEEESSKVKEAGLDFYNQNGLWRTSFDGRVFGFQYLPSEVSNISVQGIYSLGDYVNQPLYFVNPQEGISEILTNIELYILRYQEACLNGTSCAEDLPIKDCTNNLIIFIEGNASRVYQEGKCVYILGDSLAGADAFLYEVLKIN